MLGLTHWLYRQDWHAGLTREQQALLSAPVDELAAPLLEDSWQTLRHSALGADELSVEQYIQQRASCAATSWWAYVSARCSRRRIGWAFACLARYIARH
ncbi:hypothetical protein MBH78_02530 [Oceanimonas sp. NS1]|nr:hypothetical protein [Oceanimonas sp. NS1]